MKNENVNEAFEELLIGKYNLIKEIYKTKQKMMSNLASTPFGYSCYIANNNGGNIVKMSKKVNNRDDYNDLKCCR